MDGHKQDPTEDQYYGLYSLPTTTSDHHGTEIPKEATSNYGLVLAFNGRV
jgi:hypothetical protein